MKKDGTPPIRALTIFEVAARTGSYTIAGEELGLTQSAVSRQIKMLESFLGVQLFRKCGRGVELNNEVKDYHRKISVALKGIRNASNEVVSNFGSEIIRFGVLPSLSTKWISPSLPSLFSKNPHIQISMSVEPNPFDFAKRELDAALHVGFPDWKNVVCEKLFPEVSAIVAAPSLIKKANIEKASELVNYPLITGGLSQREWSGWYDWPKYFETCNFEADHAKLVRLAPILAMAEAATQGIGFAILPLFLIKNELQSGQLEVAFDKPFQTGRDYFLVYPESQIDFSSFRIFRSWILQLAMETELENCNALDFDTTL